MKNAPIFSEQDHAAFFRATREINKHLHHIKEYDQIKDIEKCFAQAKDIMIDLARQIGKIMKEFERITGIKVENNRALGEEIIEKVFGNLRNAVSIDEKLGTLKEELFQISVRKSDIFKEGTDSHEMLNKIGKKRFKLLIREVQEKQQLSLAGTNDPNENISIPVEVEVFLKELDEGEISKVFKDTNNTRRKASEQIIIIFQKIIELQRANAKYFEMLKKPINLFNIFINERIVLIERETDRIRSIFNNIDSVLNKSNYSNINYEAINAIIDGYYSLIKLSEGIRENLLEINIERYKFRGVSFYYAPNKGELLKRRYANIRKAYVFGKERTKEELIEHIQKSWTAVIKENNLLAEASLKDDIKTFLELTCHNSIAAQQRYINEIEAGPARMEEDILRRAATILGRLDTDDLKEYFGFFIKSGKIKTWTDFINRIQLVTPKGKRLVFDANWQLNVYLEKMSFKKLLADIKASSTGALERESLELFREELCALVKTEKSKEHPCSQLRSLILQHQEELPENKVKRILQYLRDRFTELEKKYKEYIEPEITYYLNCSKKHVKDATSKISSHLPTDYHPDMIKNIVLKEALSKRDLKISKRFRRVFECIDEQIFRHEKPKNGNPEAYTLWRFFWDNKDKDKSSTNKSLERFDEMVKEVVSRLEELKVRKYNLLNEYLHSDLFSDINNRLQIYGGSYSIWNQEEEHLVRMLARRFTPKKYRPHSDYRDPWFHQHALQNKWYDLAERVYDKNKGWIKNPFKDSIELMFLSEGRNISQPAFYQNFSSDSNVLLDVEKENQFLFCEDGEISAFILLYRFMNAVFNTSTEQIEKELDQEKGDSEPSSEFSKENQQTYLSDILIAILTHYERNENGETPEEKAKRKNRAKNLLTFFIKIILDANCPFKLNFAPKTSPDNVFEDAYDPLEGIARKEKFSSVMRQRIDRGPVKFVRELFTQGLLETGVDEETIKEKQNDTSAVEDLLINEHQKHLTISERYINLCKFIDKELTPSKKRLKLKANFEKYSAQINPEGYFIDRKIQKLDDYKLKEELELRQKYLDNIRKEIIDIVKKEETTRKVEKSEIQKQLAAILSLLIESVSPFLTSEDFKKEKTRESRWLKVKRHINGMSRFPLSAYFVWRANRSYAHSRLVIPIASTTTNREAPNVGFLSIGFRNVFTRNGNKPMHHITHETEDAIKEILFTIRSIYQPLIHPFMDKIYYDQIVNKSVQTNAIRAAVARVMSRNMSHNIGSHVIEKLSRTLNDPGTGEEYAPEQMQLFHTYLRTRMGFIADISTGKPHLTITSKLFRDVLTAFIKTPDKDDPFGKDYQKILLDHISGYPDLSSDAIEVAVENKAHLEKIDIALPNGNLGAHAFYIILENIIRNAFKHSRSNNLKLKLEIECDTYKRDERYMRIRIKDNLGKKNKVDRTDKLLKDMREHLDESMIDPNRKQLREKNWGLLEMKIAAAYLRQEEATQIDKYKINNSDKKYFPPLLNLHYANDDKDLVYELFLMIPKEIEIYNLDDQLENAFSEIDLLNQGVKIKKSITVKEKELINIPGNYTTRVIVLKNEDQLNDADIVKIKKPIQRIVILPLDKKKKLLKLLQQSMKGVDINDLKNFIWSERVSDLIAINRHKEEKHPRIVNASSKKCHLLYPPSLQEYTPNIKQNIPHRELKNTLVFDYHGNSISTAKKELLYYEMYNSPDPTAFLLNSIMGPEQNDISDDLKYYNQEKLDAFIYGEFIEIAFTDIAILDERVQEELNNREAMKLKEVIPDKVTFEGFENMKIFVPQKKELALTKENLERGTEVFEDIKTWLSKIVERNRPIDFLVIHYSIVESLRGNTDESVLGFIKDVEALKTKDKSKNLIGQVVLTSGRGTPPSIPKKIPFLPYSILSRYLFEQPSKYMLKNVLFAGSDENSL